MKCGNVYVTLNDGSESTYEHVANLSIGEHWVFMKCVDGSRVQLPVSNIKEIQEDNEVYVRGIKGETEKMACGKP